MTGAVGEREIVSSEESLSEAGEVIISTITYKHLALKKQGKLKKRRKVQEGREKISLLICGLTFRFGLFLKDFPGS